MIDNGMMYFGTRERMLWVRAPAPGAGFTAIGWNSKLDTLSGGVSVRNSNGAHLEYDFSWGSITRDQIAQWEDYAYGLYGDGLVYPVDPLAMDRNLFNMQWASPKITAEDGIPLTGPERPAKVFINNLSLDYPMYGAQYNITAGQPSRVFHLPIPLGYTAWVGAHGLENGRGLKVQPTQNGVDSGGATFIPVLSVANSTRFSTSVVGGPGIGIDISVDTDVTTVMTLAGLMLQLLPTGETPALGGFLSGRGNSGCVFLGKPNRMPYSLPTESIGMTAKLIEVGDWL